MRELSARGRRVVRRLLDRLRFGGHTRTVLRGPAAGILIGTQHESAEYAEGINERPVQEALARVLKPGDTFLDIGANVGFFSLLAARLVGPGGRVVAFEAVGEIAACAEHNATLNGFAQITVRPVAVGESMGRAVLRRTTHPGGATLADDAQADEVTGTEDVEVVAIDTLVANGSLPVPDLVKIDVEGHELPVLLGMEDVLRTHRPILLVELDAATPAELRERKVVVVKNLADRGYSTEVLPPAYVGTDWEVMHLLATSP